MLRVFVCCCLLLVTGYVSAEEFHLIINGKAIHLSDGRFNEKNYGLGFEYDFKPRNHWISFVNGSFFKDSNNQTSKYLGGGIKRRFELGEQDNGWHVDLGVIGFLMTRYDYKNNEPFFGALPVFSIGKDWYALNATYIPSVTPKHSALFYFQLMFRLAEF